MEKTNRNALKIGFQYGIAFLLGRLLFDLGLAAATAVSWQNVVPDVVAQLVGGWNGRLLSALSFFILLSLLISELGQRFYNQKLLWRWWAIGLGHGLWIGGYVLVETADSTKLYISATIALLMLPLFLFPGDSKTFVRPSRPPKNSRDPFIINGGAVEFKQSGNVHVQKMPIWQALGALGGLILALILLLIGLPIYQDFDLELAWTLFLCLVMVLQLSPIILRFLFYFRQRAKLPLILGTEPDARYQRVPLVAWQEISRVEVAAQGSQLWPTAEIKLHLQDGRLHTLGQISPLASLRPLKAAQQVAELLNQAIANAAAPLADSSAPQTILQKPA